MHQGPLHAQVDTSWRETPILVAELDGPDASEDAPFVLFSGHHDTWHYGVMDNGAANCTMMEVARLCAADRAEWRRGLRLCFWSGHSHGRYSGSAWYADAHWDELERRCVAHVNADSTGGRGATILTNSGASAELWALAREAIRQQGGQHYQGRRSGRLGDQSFFGIGIPALFNSLSHHEVGPDPLLRHLQLGWWWHTAEDTLDKIDPNALARDTRVFLHAVWALLSAPVLPFDYAEQARCLQAELHDLSTAVGDRLSLNHALAGAGALELEAGRVAGLNIAGSADAERINRALMQVSRALVPLDYTRGDRFIQDPAMPLPAWPALQAVRELGAAAPGSDDEQFRRVSAVRAVNRLSHALRLATAALQAV